MLDGPETETGAFLAAKPTLGTRRAAQRSIAFLRDGFERSPEATGPHHSQSAPTASFWFQSLGLPPRTGRGLGRSIWARGPFS